MRPSRSAAVPLQWLRHATDNRGRLTLASFLAYFAMSGLLSQTGVVTGALAAHFGLSVADAAARFSWFTGGIFCGSLLSLFGYGWLPLRRLFAGSYLTLALLIGAILLVDDWNALAPLLGLLGLACGLGLAGAAITLTLIYSPERRAAALLSTDVSFSLAGVLCPLLAGAAIAAGWRWSAAYAALAAVSLAVVALAMSCRYPAAGGPQSDGATRWPLGAVLCAVALFAYMLGQVSLFLWLPNHLQTALGAELAASADVVSRYWSGMAIGQIVLVGLSLRFSPRLLLNLIVPLAVLDSALFWLLHDVAALRLNALVFGLINAGILKLCISYATSLLARPPARMVSTLIFAGTLGTALSPALSARLVALGDTTVALQFASACYLATAVLVGLAQSTRRSPAAEASAPATPAG
ncbi:MFS transporter TsgA [Solimonas flava]|uniref:MFS transporter TsgA n=1 Tax=Solimonas flava TaxID=415849 RepID=UPI0013773B53|nr:MFS transporter TsgA [Solimonas flava]